MASNRSCYMTYLRSYYVTTSFMEQGSDMIFSCIQLVLELEMVLMLCAWFGKSWVRLFKGAVPWLATEKRLLSQVWSIFPCQWLFCSIDMISRDRRRLALFDGVERNHRDWNDSDRSSRVTISVPHAWGPSNCLISFWWRWEFWQFSWQVFYW